MKYKLKGPDNLDVAKLHSEINQIENQRFLLTTGAITAFAAILSFVVLKSVPPSSSQVDAFSYVGSLLVVAILTVLYLYGVLMKRVLRIYTTYLRVTAKSGWEEDYAQYRYRHGTHRWYEWRRWHWGYDQGQAFVFLILAVTGSLYPILLARAYGLGEGPSWGLPSDAATLAIFIVLVVWTIIPARRHKEEAAFKGKWEDLT